MFNWDTRLLQWLAMFVVVLLVTGVISSITEVRGQANGGSAPTSVWAVSGQGVGAIKYDRATGDSWILEARAGKYSWVWIDTERAKADHRPKNPKIIQLLRVLTPNLSVDKDPTGKAVGLHIGLEYVDPGVGLRPGDSIRSVNSHSVSSLQSFLDALENVGLETDVVIVVQRGDKNVEIQISAKD